MRGRTSGDPPSVYENPTDSNVNMAIVYTLGKVMSHSELPAPPPVTFDGTSPEFPKFMRKFEDPVASKPSSDNLQLSQLVACTFAGDQAL